MKAGFHIPDFWLHGRLNLNLIDMLKATPERFFDGVEIASVYGCFPPAIWNGGRTMNGSATESDVKRILEEFNSYMKRFL